MTSGLLVSTEIGTSEARDAGRSITGITRSQFLVDGHGRRAGPGRLPADVDDRRALGGHALGLRERGLAARGSGRRRRTSRA